MMWYKLQRHNSEHKIESGCEINSAGINQFWKQVRKCSARKNSIGIQNMQEKLLFLKKWLSEDFLNISEESFP